MEVMKCVKHLGDKGPLCGSASEQAVMQMNIEKVPKPSDVDADPAWTWGRLPLESLRTKHRLFESTGALVTACWQKEYRGNTGDPIRCLASPGNVPPVRVRVRPGGKSDRSVVPTKPGNAGGGKGP